VYRNLQNQELFLMAYAKLYANKGATTPGVDPNDTVDGMSLARINNLIKKLQEGTYRWQSVRRVKIDKKNGQKRPLGLPGWNDKLLQQVIKLVLEAYYEPRFSDHSHGFRPGRGCHTALREIYLYWKGTKWFIEGDIQGFYDHIDHDILLNILARDIKDQRFLKLMGQLLKAGYVENWKFHTTYSGVPQGSILGPLLANLVLNETDQFVENQLLPQYNQGRRRRRNPEYQQLTDLITKAKREGNRELCRQLKRQRQQLPSRDPYDPNYRRLGYVRYADDILLGYAGTRQEALEIKRRIKAFLSRHLNLTLSEEKTLITHATTQRARFLNYEIHIVQDNTKLTNNKKLAKQVARSLNGKVALSVPHDVVVEWRTRFAKKGKAVHRPYLLHCSDYEIVQTYGLEFQGLVNYYTMAHNVASKLYSVKYHFQESLVKTIAAKHKKSTPWVYGQYRRKSEHGVTALMVEVPNPNNPNNPLVASFGDRPIRYDSRATIRDNVARMYHGRSELVRRLLANKCELCGSSESINVHHVRKLKDVKKRYKGRKEPPAWVQFMIARSRKTVVVCHRCHVEIHNGRYDRRKVE
jgi:group II intron reverse transcriptase/maturase